MEELESLQRSKEISLYELHDEQTSGVEEYIFSTPETREICNRPEKVGISFPETMRAATDKLLQLSPLKELLGQSEEMRNCVLHFLRGGLNFQLREALFDAYGFTRHYCSYMTSQRYQRGKRWKIKQDQYRKISYLPGSTILIGDCVATGSTLENGLEVLLEDAREQEQPISNLILFTIGCENAREILQDFHERFSQEFDYDRTMVFYIEARFGLSNEDMDLTVTLPGTDLLRHPAVLAPEYERSLYNRLHVPVERCTIYDLGAKSFTYQKHVNEVIEYWQKLKDSDLTLREAYRERWPETDYSSPEALEEARREIWPFIESEEIESLYSAYQSRWEEISEKADTHQALVELADRRIQIMESLLADER